MGATGDVVIENGNIYHKPEPDGVNRHQASLFLEVMVYERERNQGLNG